MYTWIFNYLNLSINGIMLFKLACFGELVTNNYSLVFCLNLHTCQNQSCVARKSKVRKWKKLNDSLLII